MVVKLHGDAILQMLSRSSNLVSQKTVINGDKCCICAVKFSCRRQELTCTIDELYHTCKNKERFGDNDFINFACREGLHYIINIMINSPQSNRLKM